MTPPTNERFPRRLTRFGGTPLLLATLTVAALVAVAIVATIPSGTKPGAAPKATPTTGLASGVGKGLCDVQRVRCATVATAHGSAEYAVLTAGGGRSRGLVLVELGGPGVDLFTRSGVDSLGLPNALESYDLVLIREPWAQHERPAHCPARLDAMGSDIAAGRSPSQGVNEGDCALPTWDRASYADTVTAIVAAEGRPLTGVVGQSFGALPAVAAARAAPEAWLLLHAPIAPPDVTGRALLSGRARTLGEALDASYATECRTLRLDCRRTGRQVLAAAMAATDGRTVPGRGRPLGRGDVELAAIAAAYDLTANQRWLWRTLTALPDAPNQDWITLGRLADQLLQRYDSQAVSPKLGAYIAGMCASYTGWSLGSAAGIPAFFQAMARQCPPPRSTSAWSGVGPGKRRGPTCILVNDQDTVVSPVWAQSWRRLLAASTISHYGYRGHVSLAQASGLSREACGLFTAARS